MIITRTPYRVSLFGGGSDHPQWFATHGGKVISFTIDKYCYLTMRILPPFFSHNFRIAYSIVEMVKHFNEIDHPVIRECIRRHAPHLMLEIHHHGDLPARSGVGSSSAFTVGVIHALLALQGKPTVTTDLANLAIEMEQKILKENVGWQDQIACAIGGLNRIDFAGDLSWKITDIKLPLERLRDFESRLVVVYTGVSRNSSDISLGLIENLQSKVSEMRNLMEMVEVCQEILVGSSDLDVIGEMLDESWKLKRSINNQSSSSSLDAFYSSAKKAGALGGKILGAGGGGFFLFWLREGQLEDFKSRFTQGTFVPIKVSYGGSEIIHDSQGLKKLGSL